MPYLPWIKLYTDIIANPKLYQLSEPRRWRFVQLLALAGECDSQGYLVISGVPLTPDYLAWRLLVNLETMQNDLRALANLELIVLDEVRKTRMIPSFSLKQGRPSEKQKEKWRSQKQRQRSADRRPANIRHEEYEPEEPGDPELLTETGGTEHATSGIEQESFLDAEAGQDQSTEYELENPTGVREKDIKNVFQKDVRLKRRIEKNRKEKRETKRRGEERQRPPPTGRLKSASQAETSVFDQVAQELGLKKP
jgi:hypothetical protein